MVELNDQIESLGGKPGAKSHLYESGDDDVYNIRNASYFLILTN